MCENKSGRNTGNVLFLTVRGGFMALHWIIVLQTLDICSEHSFVGICPDQTF